MTAIQANRERTEIESRDRAANLKETSRSNRANEKVNKSRARAEHINADTRAREVSVKESLAPYQKAESVTKSVSNAAKAFKDGVTAVKDISTAVSGTRQLSFGGLSKAINDWAWYFPDAQRMSDVTNLPMFIPYGTTFDPKLSVGASAVNVSSFGIPGLITFETNFTIGHANAKTSAIQRSAEAYFDFINARTGRNSNYEPADLMMLALSFAQLDAYSEFLKRAYRCLSISSPLNSYLPRTLITAMGLDYDDLIANKQAFRDHINYIEDMKFKYVSLPGMPIHARWNYEMSNVFADTTSACNQLYMYVPHHFLKLVIGEATPTRLEEFRWGSVLKDLSDVREYTNELLAGFIGMEDVRGMKADILNAYGDRARYVKQYIREDEREQTVATDPLNLIQFQNATILRNASELSDGDVTQECSIGQVNGIIASSPKGSYISSYIFMSRSPIRAHDLDTMSSAQKNILAVEATRLMHMPTYISTDKEWALSTPAASFISGVNIFTSIKHPVSDRTEVVEYTLTSNIITISDPVDTASFVALSLAKSFRFAPTLWITGQVDYTDALGPEVASQMTIAPSFDWDQALTIDKEQLGNMNDTIALHLFGVRSMP